MSKEAVEAGVGGLLVQFSMLDFQPLVAVEVDLQGWWWKRRGAGLDAVYLRSLGPGLPRSARRR